MSGRFGVDPCKNHMKLSHGFRALGVFQKGARAPVKAFGDPSGLIQGKFIVDMIVGTRLGGSLLWVSLNYEPYCLGFSRAGCLIVLQLHDRPHVSGHRVLRRARKVYQQKDHRSSNIP